MPAVPVPGPRRLRRGRSRHGGPRLVKTDCECTQSVCTRHRDRPCPDLGLIILFSVDVPDHTGTLMCATCRDRALESGRYDAGRLGARPKR